ncbi:restriction endonuclease subunit S [Sporomusa malonica]|uniref:Type I restriction enzyme, S subunit n=1 Tax=Sporomusa malonica TaxID=112901 RepID=A0A1W2BBH5_9FIRM|nr:restriction endonuclease subunit S [Sporomusa malonica]SMC70194.1 type I restriction enzyme, S subunit [Sporomusa malonica]
MKYKWVALRDAATYVNGYAFKPEEWSTEGTPIIRIQNLTNTSGVFNYYQGNYLEKYIVNKGDILISWSASLGVYQWTGQQALLNQHIFKVVFDKIEIDKSFFKYAIFKVLREMEKYTHGSTMKHITKKYFDEIKIPLPPLETQKKIAAVLDKAQELIDKRKEQLVKLDEFVQSVFLEMFGDPISNPKGWIRKPLGDYIDILTDYHANGSYEVLRDNVELLDQKNYALMVRTTDLENGNFFKNVKYITKDAYEFLTKTKVYGGELIINKIGSAGKVYLMPCLERPVSLGMNQFMIRLLSGLNNIYVYHLFNTASGKSLILNNVRGAVTKTITKDAIRGILVPITPVQLQNQFAAIVEKTEQQKALMQQSLVEMENNFNSLMQRAFKGELF